MLFYEILTLVVQLDFLFGYMTVENYEMSRILGYFLDFHKSGH